MTFGYNLLIDNIFLYVSIFLIIYSIKEMLLLKIKLKNHDILTSIS